MTEGEPLVRNLLMWVQYDGTAYSGWQQQAASIPTVQAALGQAIQQMVRHPVTLHGSSRTDAGVHARAMPVCFETERAIPERGFLLGLNSTLPADLGVLGVREVPRGWRPRDAAVAKTYVYRVYAGAPRRPLIDRQAWHLRHPPTLDLPAMQAAAQHLLGEHDFQAFRSARCEAKTTTRAIHALSLEPGPDALLELRVTGNAFLHNMVRIIAGTLVEVGQGRRAPGSVAALLAGGARKDAGITAPARGLTLWRVHFSGYPRLGKPEPPPALRVDLPDDPDHAP